MAEPTPLSKPTPDTADFEQYARLLQEARGIHGVSLWQDAWQRLRRNRVAMCSLYFVIAISVLAVFVPLLPLPLSEVREKLGFIEPVIYNSVPEDIKRNLLQPKRKDDPTASSGVSAAA